MINYKLAKKLKDVGFQQKYYFGVSYYVADKDIPNTIHIHTPDAPGFYNEKRLPIKVKIPTLSELIEACGDGFASLNKGIDNKFHAWATRTDTVKHIEDIYGEGEVPEEAVANLWLKLNDR